MIPTSPGWLRGINSIGIIRADSEDYSGFLRIRGSTRLGNCLLKRDIYRLIIE